MNGNLTGLAAIVNKSRSAKADEPEPQVSPTAKDPNSQSAASSRSLGKSRDKNFERLTVYVRKDTKKKATRKWEDATGQDTSDLVEQLLARYLNT